MMLPCEPTRLPPWQELENALAALECLPPEQSGSVHELAVIEGPLQLGEGSRVLPGCVFEGPVRIGKNCKIGPNAYLRGGVIIGDNCVVGQAVEIKSSVLGNRVAVAHLSYIGDSLLRDDINVGGGCILSNFRHDAGEIRMLWQGKLCPTGRHKLGCYIGSGARLGCRCVVLPGRVIAADTCTDPGSVVCR